MELLLAPAGQGKTAYVIKQVRALQVTDPLAPIWVIVPNRQQAQAFRRRLATSGGGIGVEIKTFHGIYAELLARQGQPIPVLFKQVQYRILRNAIDDLHSEGALAHYAPLRHKPGFLRRLRELILELKQAFIKPEDLSAALMGEPARLTELASLYLRYQDWIGSSGWPDAEGQSWMATKALEKDPALASHVRLLIVDGFDEFNRTQLAVLEQLAQRSPETIVTLTGEKREVGEVPREAHHRYARTQQALIDLNIGMALSPLVDTTMRRDEALVHLERNLFAVSTLQQADQEAVTLLEARDRNQEARAALRWLKTLIVREKIRPDQVALLARNLAPYRPFIAEAAAEFGLALRWASEDDLLSNPAIVAVLNLLSLSVLDWPQRQVLEAWHSPYFDWQAQIQAGGDIYASAEEVAARLADVVRDARIVGGLDQWRTALAQRAQISEEAIREQEQGRAMMEGPLGGEAAALSVIFEAFVSCIQPLEQATLAEYIAFVEDIIGDDPRSEAGGRNDIPAELASPDAIGSEQKSRGAHLRSPTNDDTPFHPPSDLQVVASVLSNPSTSERDETALQTFKDVLRGLRLAESVIRSLDDNPHTGPIPYHRFWSELRGAVEAATYSLPVAKTEAVLVASVPYARGLSFEAVALLGLSEGEFPQQEQEDPLLRDGERRAMAQQGVYLPTRMRGDEVTFFYEAMTRARRKMLLTRPYLAEDGQPWEPSPYWLEVQRLVDVAPVRAMGTPVASIEELLVAWGDRQPTDPPGLPKDLIGQWDEGRKQVQRSVGVLRARLSKQAAGLYEGDATILQERLHRRYHPRHIWSSSRLEAYATCPYSFFARSTLDLKPRAKPEEGFDILIRGSLYHEILEDVYQKAIEQNDFSESALLALLPIVSESIFAAAPAQYGFRPTALWDHQQAEISQLLAQTLAALAQVADDFRPFSLEGAFGLDGAPVLNVQTDAGSFRLRGFIDRIDQDSAGRLRIIDYKSGSQAIRPQDLDEGKRIQLPLYALAAAQALNLGDVTDGFYWHIGSSEASRLRLGSYAGGVAGAQATAVQHALSDIQGIRSGRFLPQPPSSGCPSSCAAIEFCWRVRKGWS